MSMKDPTADPPKRPAGRPRKIYTAAELREKAQVQAAKAARGKGRPKKVISPEEELEKANRPVAPRGRPRKPEGAEKSTYRKKNKVAGRPRKTPLDESESPRKSPGKSASKSPGRGRGRPKMSLSSSTVKSSGGKRGRPKNALIVKTPSGKKVSKMILAAKPRGRPKKSAGSPGKATGGKRGRPKKVVPEPEVVEKSSEESSSGDSDSE